MAAAPLLAILAGLGLSDATGITHVTGTVIRLLSPEGTLVIEVDDPGVSVAVDGADVVLVGAGAREIRLKPSQYRVSARKGGKLINQQSVTVTRGRRQVVRVTREPGRERSPAVAAGGETVDGIATGSREGAAPAGRKPLGKGPTGARAATFAWGEWSDDGDAIGQGSKQKPALLLFGEPDWGDLDFSCEVLYDRGSIRGDVVVRASGLDHYAYFSPYCFDSLHDLEVSEPTGFKRLGCSPGTPHDRAWLVVMVKVRGPSIECFVDGKPLIKGVDDRRGGGLVGLRTWDGEGQFRNVRVTAPDGHLLWEGPPALEGSRVAPPGAAR